MKPIAHIENDYITKFGIPRQAGLAEHVISRIVFEEEFRNPDALRGIETFSHLWLIWEFSEAKRETWSPTVRPPRLGGNQRIGVFATRSPFRPNPIGLSCVELDHVERYSAEGPVLYVKGADLMNGTPIFDIKPYIPYADAHPEASAGFTGSVEKRMLDVEIDEEWTQMFGTQLMTEVREILMQDPRPAYQEDPERIYGMEFGRYNIRFQVRDGTARIIDIDKNKE